MSNIIITIMITMINIIIITTTIITITMIDSTQTILPYLMLIYNILSLTNNTQMINIIINNHYYG